MRVRVAPCGDVAYCIKVRPITHIHTAAIEYFYACTCTCTCVTVYELYTLYSQDEATSEDEASISSPTVVSSEDTSKYITVSID